MAIAVFVSGVVIHYSPFSIIDAILSQLSAAARLQTRHRSPLDFPSFFFAAVLIIVVVVVVVDFHFHFRCHRYLESSIYCPPWP
jgi:hypothetical protein